MKTYSQNTQSYFLGLDMGTNSLGFAVTDTDYNVIRKKGRHLWGVRLFKEASTAVERRIHRIARRRLKRKKERVAFLKTTFADSIQKVDSSFYQRLEDSFLHPEDKLIKQKYSLFNDEHFSDYNYHDKYPTIYHLRKDLMDDPSPKDVRLVFLALLHILKNRGHFLFSGSKFNLSLGFDESFQAFLQAFNLSLSEENVTISESELRAILTQEGITRNSRSGELNKLFLKERVPSQTAKEAARLLAGLSCNLARLFDDENLKEAEVPKCDFSKDFETERDTLASMLTDEQLDFLDASQNLFNWMRLNSILGDHETLSHAKVACYEKHKTDLKRLKEVVKLCDSQENSSLQDNEKSSLYRLVFSTSQDKLNNYVAYTGHLQRRGRKQEVVYRNREQQDFLSFLLKILKDYASLPEVEKLLFEIKAGDFIPLQIGRDNAAIPHQIIFSELSAILENATHYLAFLDKETCQRISQMFAFRIPYYVGPLNPAHKIDESKGKHAWVIRKEKGRVYPWNFENKVDVERSAEKFIENMTRNCSYLRMEKALPKQSLLLSEFMLLNAVNAIRVQGQRLDPELRDKLIEDLFVDPDAPKRITKRRVADWFTSNGYDIVQDDLSGFDLDIPVQLTALHDYMHLGHSRLSIDEMEEVIKTITLFPDDTAMVNKRLTDQYGQKLSKEQIEFLSRRKYKDWGRLSAKLLTGIRGVGEYDYEKTIIQMMREEPILLMELLSDQYTFSKQIISINDDNQIPRTRFSYEILDDYLISPAIRRMIGQTMLVCQDVCKIMGGPPKKIFIEVARGENASKQRTTSRKKQLQDLYNQCTKDSAFWTNELRDKLDIEDNRNLLTKKVFLYYLQLGRCAYSGDIIDIEDLYSSRIDIDHIYPRSLTKDDSIHNNLVLVKAGLNRMKGDQYPVPESFQHACHGLWSHLRSQGLIGIEKYDRLTRKSPLADEELAGFINRQLVETRQATKVATDILARLFGESTRIICVKAKHVNDFRYNDFRSDDLDQNPAGEVLQFVKCRDVISDIHHAKDAYLNVVVGNVLDEKFTKNPLNFIRKTRDQHGNSSLGYSFARLYNHNIQIQGHDDSYAWVCGPEGTIGTVKSVMKRNDVLYTEKTEFVDGAFYDIQPLKASKIRSGSKIGKVPLKGGTEIENKVKQIVMGLESRSPNPLSNIERYGAYNKERTAFFSLVDYQQQNGNRLRSILPVPISFTKIMESNPSKANELLTAYFREECKSSNLRVIIERIPVNSVFEIDGYRCRIRGKTGDRFRFVSHIQAALDEPYLSQLNKIQQALRIINSRNIEDASTDEAASLQDEINHQLGDIDLLHLAHKLLERLMTGPWSRSPQLYRLAQEIQGKLETFREMTIQKQLNAVIQIASTMGRDQLFDLSSLGLSKNKGARSIKMEKRIVDDNLAPTVYLLHQSPSGFYESRTIIW